MNTFPLVPDGNVDAITAQAEAVSDHSRRFDVVMAGRWMMSLCPIFNGSPCRSDQRVSGAGSNTTDASMPPANRSRVGFAAPLPLHGAPANFTAPVGRIRVGSEGWLALLRSLRARFVFRPEWVRTFREGVWALGFGSAPTNRLKPAALAARRERCARLFVAGGSWRRA